MSLLMQMSRPDLGGLSSLGSFIVLVETWPSEMDTRTPEEQLKKEKVSGKGAKNCRNFTRPNFFLCSSPKYACHKKLWKMIKKVLNKTHYKAVSSIVLFDLINKDYICLRSRLWSQISIKTCFFQFIIWTWLNTTN